MQKKQKSKEMSGEASDPKGKKLICIKECVAPGYGHFKGGDVITDPALVDRFSDNPHFEIKEG